MPLDPVYKTIYEWEQQRRRPDGRFDVPVGGFGLGGKYTLRLPSPKAGRSWSFDAEGEVIHAPVPSCLEEDPKIRQARDEVIRCARRIGPTRLEVGEALLRYAARVILRNYRMTPEELTGLLSRGSQWQEGMVRHALGGDDVVEALARLSPPSVPNPPPPAPAPILGSPVRTRTVPSRFAWLAFWRQ